MARNFNIKEIEIKSFRGIKEFNHNFQGKSLVLCGPNGTGKSSITQAFEYLFTGELISLKDLSKSERTQALIHKGDSGDDLLIRVKIGNNYLERTPNDEFNPGNLKEIYDDFKNGSFILNRKKLLSFIESKPGQRYKHITSLISYEKYDDIETNLRQAYKDLKAELGVYQNQIDEKYNNLTSFYDCNQEELEERINTYLEKYDLDPIDKNTDLKAYIEQNKVTKPHKILNYDIVSLNKKYLKLLDDYENITLRELKNSNLLLSLLNQSKKYILYENPSKCPICQKDMDNEEIICNLDPQIEKISKDLNLYDSWKIECENIMKELSNLNFEISDFNSENPNNILNYDLNETNQSLRDLSNFDKKITEIDKSILVSLNDEISLLRNKIEKNSGSISIQLDNIELLYLIRNEEKEIEKFQTRYDVAKSTHDLFIEMKKEELKNILKKIESHTIEFYNFIHEKETINNPKMEISRSSSLKLSMLFGDEEFEPRAYSSEGHIDTLGLCLFLAFVKEFNEYKFIILDDIISTVDLEHKEQVINLLFEYFDDYKFIITTHNRLWFEQLSRLAEYYKQGKFEFYEITDWDEKIGPSFSRKKDEKERIELYIKENDTFAAGNAIRRQLEYELDKICKVNEIPLPIKKHYTVGDYFEPVMDFAEDMFENTNVEEYYKDVFEKLDVSLYKANLTSHNNEMNYDLNMTEIKKLRDAAYNLEIAFKCKNHAGNKVLRFNKDKCIGYCSHKKCNDFFVFKRYKKNK